MRRQVVQVAWLILLGACRTEKPVDSELAQGWAYITDPAVGRAALEASLVGDTGYGRLRLAKYRPTLWGALPIANPRVAPVFPGEQPGEFKAIDLDVAWTPAGLKALGEVIFDRWPVQIAPAWLPFIEDPDALSALGMTTRPDGTVPLVWVDLPDGPQPAVVCATCHSAVEDGAVLKGRANAALNYGETVHASWGPGRLDVTADGVDNPAKIADLRPIRRQHSLNRAATLKNSLLALTLRCETQIITSVGQVWQPPRVVSFALAYYLWHLADDQPPVPEGQGKVLFSEHCGGCHQGDDLSGPPVPMAGVGTPDAVGLSTQRGTGFWQVPSLRGVGDRGGYFAEGSVKTLAEVLNPQREVPGHRFGFELSAEDRAILVGWLTLL